MTTPRRRRPPATTTGAPATTGAGAADFDKAAFCGAYLDVTMVGAAAGDPEADPIAGATALLEPAKKAAALAPPELAAELATSVDLLQQAVDTKDGSLLGQADPAATNEWTAANCGWTKVAVTAEDYHFTGVPETLAAGDYEFEMTNTGKEFHVLVIVARKPGVTESFEQLLSDPAGESKVVTLMGVAAPRARRRRARCGSIRVSTSCCARSRSAPPATPRAPARPTSPPGCSRPSP